MEMKKSTEVVLVWELYEQGMSKSSIARQLGRHRETVIRYKKNEQAYIETSTAL